MKNKLFRYFFREYGDTVVGIINANNENEAMEIFKSKYPNLSVSCSLKEIEFKNNLCELYYGG